MARFTDQNTDGWSPEELRTLNAAYDRLVADFGADGDYDAEQNISARVNNAWIEGATADYLVAEVTRLLRAQ